MLWHRWQRIDSPHLVELYPKNYGGHLLLGATLVKNFSIRTSDAIGAVQGSA